MELATPSEDEVASDDLTTPGNLTTTSPTMSHHVIDELSITKAMPKEASATLDGRVSLQFPEIKKSAIGVTQMIAESWIDVMVHSEPEYKVGVKMHVELIGHPEIRSFTVMGKIIAKSLFQGEDLLRVQFDSIGTLARRALASYLEKHAKKLN
jgi:hypothetical protein